MDCWLKVIGLFSAFSYIIEVGTSIAENKDDLIFHIFEIKDHLLKLIRVVVTKVLLRF